MKHPVYVWIQTGATPTVRAYTASTDSKRFKVSLERVSRSVSAVKNTGFGLSPSTTFTAAATGNARKPVTSQLCVSFAKPTSEPGNGREKLTRCFAQLVTTDGASARTGVVLTNSKKGGMVV